MTSIIKHSALRTLSTLGLAQLHGYPEPPAPAPDFKDWSPEILMTSADRVGLSKPYSGAATSAAAPALIDGNTGAVIQ